MTKMPLLVVAGALSDAAGRVLVQRRPAGKQHADLWELPGGKVEPGESMEAALVRELAEELDILVHPGEVRPLAFSTIDLGDRHLVLLLYRVERWSGQPQPHDAQEIRWVAPAALSHLDMPPADRPLIAVLQHG